MEKAILKNKSEELAAEINRMIDSGKLPDFISEHFADAENGAGEGLMFGLILDYAARQGKNTRNAVVATIMSLMLE